MAIPLFVKVPPYVAKKMQLDTLRFKTADGNYILRQSDFLPFGPVARLNEYAARVGGVVLRDAEAAANQRGDMNTPLPDPTDPEWTAPAEVPEVAEEEDTTYEAAATEDSEVPAAEGDEP